MPSVPHCETNEKEKNEKWVPKNGELVYASNYGSNRKVYTYIGLAKARHLHVLQEGDRKFVVSAEVHQRIPHTIIVDGKEQVISDDTYRMLTSQ